MQSTALVIFLIKKALLWIGISREKAEKEEVVRCNFCLKKTALHGAVKMSKKSDEWMAPVCSSGCQKRGEELGFHKVEGPP